MKRKREEQDTKKGGKESNTIRGRKRSKEKDKPRNISKRSQRSKREEERRCSNRSQRKQQVSREVTEERKESRAAERKKGKRDAADEAKEDAGVEGVSPLPSSFPFIFLPSSSCGHKHTGGCGPFSVTFGCPTEAIPALAPAEGPSGSGWGAYHHTTPAHPPPISPPGPG